MNDPRYTAKRSSLEGEEPRSEVYLEPIDDPGFEDIAADAAPVQFHFKKNKRKQTRTFIALLCCGILLLTSVLVYYFVENQKKQAAEIAAQQAAEEALRIQLEQERIEYQAMLDSTVFAPGITIDGIAVGDMTKEQAKTALAPVVQQVHTARELQLTYGDKLYSLDLSTVLASHDLDEVLNTAFALGKSGEYETLKKELADIKANGRAFTLTAGYDTTALAGKVAELAAQIDKPMQNAAVSNVNTEDNSIEFTDGVAGVTLEQAVLLDKISAALKSSDLTPIAIPVVETQPVVSKEALSAKYVQRSTATTDFSSSSSDRKYNVRKGAGMITGTVLKPGETFSTNDTLGMRTEKNGWKVANAYESGAVVPQAGGGVCQLSSTLYNAAVKADLEIVFRRNHSMPVAYIDKGLDATINSVGNIIDFQFKNNTDSDIVIFGYTTNNKKLTFDIWGVPFASGDFDEIKLSSELVETNEPEGEITYVEVPEGTEKADGTYMQIGEEYTAVASRKGYKYQSYKNYYKDGSLVRTEKLATSNYKAYTGEIWTCMVGMEPTVDPYTAITPEPFVPFDPVILETPIPYVEPTPTPFVIPDSMG